MTPETLRRRVDRILGAAVTRMEPITGGDINQAFLLQTDQGRYFLKANDHSAALEMFETEAAGLELIRNARAVRCPEVIAYERAGSTAFLLLEFIEPGERTSEFWRSFGADLARLHLASQPGFGLPFDNYIGSLPQPNPPAENWPDFYRRARLEPQLELARPKGRLLDEDFRHFDRLFRKLPDLLPNEDPSLIHGDLWSGNFLAGAKGEAVLIDPAVGRAHREMDIAMTKLFGGFSRRFYEAYHSECPLLSGWEERLPLYQLYYLLVHVNLFGGGYAHSVRQILQRYT